MMESSGSGEGHGEITRMSVMAIGLIATALASGPPPDAVELRPGSPAPAWADLIGTDGARHSLADLKDKKVVVVVFFANSCPDSRDYEDRLIALSKDYAARAVAVVLVNVCLRPEDDLPHMTERARRKGYPFAYLLDPSQTIGRRYAARTTPTAFVLDPPRQVVYRGAIDDHYRADRVRRRYVREAIDAALAGRSVTTAETEAPGCDIDYEPPPG
jgi:thiol-disulfide isomerase/thioredoxin